MSKTLLAGMTTMVQGRGRTLAWAVTITRRDGAVLRLCGGTRDKTIDGNVYQARPGFNLSNITCSLGATVVDTLEMTVLPSSSFEKLDFLTGRWWGARFEFNQFDWKTPANGFIPWPTYRVSDVTPKDGAFVLQMRDLRVTWRQDYTLATTKECQNRLGDYRCLVDLPTFTFAFTITTVNSARRVFTASALAQAADYFTEGVAYFDDGPYAGLPLFVLDHATGGVITLAVPLAVDMEVAQTGTLVAGCLKRLEDCRDKFDNVLNMRAPGIHGKTLEQQAEG
jgi:uncharacterized phage protein (TIGR02218 family)